MALPQLTDDGLRELVTAVDPKLEFQANMHPDATSCFTLRVTKEGVDHVLKVRGRSHNMWDDRYFHYEIHALHRASERKLTNVTRLLETYENERHQAILKDYAEGTPGNRVGQEALFNDRGFIERLDAIYLKLRLAGIAKIHFEPRKVVIADDGEVTLIDLSTCIVNTEVGMLQFFQEMREDTRFIADRYKQLDAKATSPA